MTQKYNVNRERSLESTKTGTPLPVLARGHSPEEIAIAREEVQRLLESENPRDQKILISLGSGFKPREIAENLGVSEKTVRRVTHRLKARKSHEP
jgi:DNA-binding NarL/FixJ family response regulator